MAFLFLMRSNIFLSSSSNVLLSKTAITRSLFSSFSMLFLIPIPSTISSLSLMPAVSNKFITTPLTINFPSTISLVVPLISVTIALSSLIKRFKIE